MSCLSNKRYPFQCSIALKKFPRDREAKWSLILDWGMQEHQKEVLLILTNSSCVCWLCKVFWHLPVDVKPERGKATAIKQVEHFNTLHVPKGRMMLKFFHPAFQIFSVCRRMSRKNKTKQKILFLLYNYVTTLLLGSNLQSTSLCLPLPCCHGPVQSELWEVSGKRSCWTSL